MLSYTKLTKEDFDKLIRDILIKFEKFVDRPYDDNDGNIAIGYGFDLTMHTNETIDETAKKWEEYFNGINFIKTIDFKTILNTQIKVGNQQKTVHSLLLEIKSGDSSNIVKVISSFEANNFILKSEEEGFNLLKKLLNSYYIDLHNHLKSNNVTIDNFKDTYENVALLSLFYNGKTDLVGPGLMGALKNSDRFKAWYEIRYNSNGNKLSGLAKRRMYEGYFFGLYENREANNEILNNKLPSKDMILFSDILNIFQYLNYAGFNSKKKSYTALEYFKYYENNHIYINDNTTIVSNRQAFEKDIPYFLCDDLFKPVHEYVNHLFGNKYTDSQGKIIESFDLDKIFVIDTALLSANNITLQAKLHDIITYFGNNITSSSSTGNDLTPEETSLNLLIIMKGSNPSVINFNDLLRNKDFVSITLVLLKDNNCIDVSEINTENVNILSCDPNNPDKIEQIKGKIEVQQSSTENEDIDFSSDLNFSAEGYTARYKPESKTLVIYDENDNKVVELCNYIPGTTKAAIESDKFMPESELGDEQPYGSFEYKCIIEYKYNVSAIKGAPFYAYIFANKEIIPSKIQVESKDNIYAIFKFNIDSNKVANSKVAFSANKQELQSLKDVNKLAQSTGLISLAELKAGHKDGKHQLSNIFLVNDCSVKQGDKCFILEAHYSKSLDEPFYKEKAKNTKWGYIIQSGCNEIKFSNQNVNYIETKTGSTITINYDELEPPFNKSMSINFYPYMVSPSQKVYASVRCEPLSYSVSSCEKDEKSYGIYSVRAIYKSRNTVKQTGNNSQSQFVITDEVKQNTKWIILSFKSTLSQQEIDSIRNQYLSMQTIKIEECTFNDYSVKKTTGSELKYELKNCQEWVDSIVYFYPYVYSIEKDICQSWDLRQPFYLSFTGSTLSIKSVLFSIESNNLTNTLISVAAYSGKPLEQKPENSFYKSYEVDINKKKMYFVYDKERQLLVKEGPIPERDYYLDLEDIRKMNFWGDRDHWGKYNTPLYSIPSLDNQEILLEKDTKRNNFYIHGGLEYGDEGGIDLADKDKNFFNKLEELKKEHINPKVENTPRLHKVNNTIPIRVQVEYEKDGWHDPLDKMEICLFSQGGHYKPFHNTFGLKVRDGTTKHQGVDLFARVGTPVYACMDGEIISTKGQHNDGTVILKVTGKQVEILRNMEKKDYQNILYNEIKTENYRDDNLNFKYDSDMFVFRYMHLDEVYVTNTETDKYVKCGQIIGRSGIKEYANKKYDNSHNPHLHFEISSSDAMKTGKTGLNYRINPRVYINYKIPNLDLSSRYTLSVTTCQEYFKSGVSNNVYLNNAYKEFREQVECMLNPAPYRIKQKQ